VVTPAPQRKDAARNWHRIVEVGRRLVDEGAAIQLNEVAREAVVGVATVYRHFPTPEALLETIATPGLESLSRRAERALAEDDTWSALCDFLRTAIDAQMTDAALPPVLAAPQCALPYSEELRQRLTAQFSALLGRAQAAGVADPAVTPGDIAPLMCGVTFAARVHPAATVAQRAATARRYLDLLLKGIRVVGQ
jgi:AcrR family transcriptional regulator